MSEKAKAAIAATLKRIKEDPRVAYYICPMTQTYDLLVAAHCELNGLDESEFTSKFEPSLRFENPAKESAKSSDGQVDTVLMKRIADRLVIGITTGRDWPNSDDELLRLQAAELLRMAAGTSDSTRNSD